MEKTTIKFRGSFSPSKYAMKRDIKSGLDSWCARNAPRYLAMSVSTNRSTGYRSLCCLNWRSGWVLLRSASMIPTTLTSSHFPSSSSASSAFAQDPNPSLSSVLESVKSHNRFPIGHISLYAHVPLHIVHPIVCACVCSLLAQSPVARTDVLGAHCSTAGYGSMCTCECEK